MIGYKLFIKILLVIIILNASCENKEKIPSEVLTIYNSIKEEAIINSFKGVMIRPRGDKYLFSIDSIEKTFLIHQGMIVTDFDTTSAIGEKNIATLSEYDQRKINYQIKKKIEFMTKNNILSINGYTRKNTIIFECTNNYNLLFFLRNSDKKDIYHFHPNFNQINKKWGYYKEIFR